MDTTHDFLGKRILVLTAHPDDEAFCACGTMHANILAGGETALACASLGGRGKAHLDRELTEDELKALRFGELHAATGCLGMHEVHVFDFPDGELSEHMEAIAEVWKPLIAEFAPEAILGFGSDGYTGHADHIAVGAVARALARDAGIPYYAFALPGDERRILYRDCLQKKRALGTYDDAESQGEPDVCVHVDRERKLEALRHHASQFGGLDPFKVFPPEIAEHFLTHEYFASDRGEG